MYDPQFVMSLHLMQMRAEEARQWAGTERMLREAGLDRRVWPSWQVRKRLLVRAGTWLVTAGQGLQLRYQPEAPSFKGKGIGRHEAAQP
jgi:hypothetical protein